MEHGRSIRRFILAVGLIVNLWFALPHALSAQTAAPRPASPAGPAAAPATPPPQALASSNPEFLKAADEVLSQMSEILHLPIKEPLKKSLRSKQEIRDYLIRTDKEDKNDAQRYADTKSLVAFGLIPKDFPLDDFMLDILTD